MIQKCLCCDRKAFYSDNRNIYCDDCMEYQRELRKARDKLK